MIKLSTILIALLATNILYATNYYVDATGGNDTNNGISPNLAWQTITKVNQQTFLPGDSILFKRGEIWRGRLIPQGNGNASNWIVYSGYGTGARPQLLGSGQVTNWVLHSGNIYKKSNLNLPSYAGDGLYEFDQVNQDPIILIEDDAIPSAAGHWYYDENENNGTVYIICSDGAAPATHNIEICMYEEIVTMDYLSYIEFSNFSLKFGNCKNMMIYSCDHINITNINSSFQGYYGNPNIFSMGGNFIKIEDCVLYESCNSGIAFYPIGTSRPGHYNTVQGCRISKMQTNDGITIHENSSGDLPGDYFLLENNIISECPEGSIDVASDYHVFRNNICFNNGEDAFQIGGNHILVENNLCYGNARHGIISFSDDEGGNIIRNNVIYHNVKHGLMSGDKPLAIYNNTICNSETRSEVYFGYNNAPNGAIYKNNIVYNDLENSSVYFANGLPLTVEMDYNNYHVIESDSLIFGIAETGEHHTLNEIQTIYNREINSFLANPTFVDVSNNDFHLDANSLCIDAGSFLCKTTTNGSGNEIPVEDVSYFCDGYGIVDGDSIQLEEQTQHLKITSIDTVNNIISVDQNISWSIDDGVALVYNGTAPDIGAYEYYIPVGVAESTLNEKMIVFPNPVKNDIYISEEYVNKDYQIISLSGVIIKSGKIDGHKIDLSKLKSGIYFIKITDKGTGEINVFKLVKE